MSLEDEFIESLAERCGKRGRRGKLIQVAQTIRNGQVVARVFVPPFARIGAVVTAEDLFLKRQYGQTSPGLSIPWSVYPAVLTALRHWKKHRDNWWAFYYSCSGFPGGMGGAEYIAKPGKDSDHEQVYRSVLGRRTGEMPKGEDRTLSLKKPEVVNETVAISAHIRRVGWTETDPNPQVGVVYQLPQGMKCKALRMEAKIARGGAHVYIERDELKFLEELQRLRDSGMA